MLRQKNQQSVYDQIGVRSAQLLMDLHKLNSQKTEDTYLFSKMFIETV